MIEIIQKLIPFISISFSIYIYFMYLSQKEDIDSMKKYMKIYGKHIAQNEKNINILNVELKKLDDSISNIKTTSINNKDMLDKKIIELYERWKIVADDRITSIPQTNKDWWDAKEIIEQKEQKKWKGKNLSQTKDSFVNENVKYNNQVKENEEEINQDFSEFSDEDFENIIDEDEEDSSSSSATDNTQNRKPKPKKDKPKQMKM